MKCLPERPLETAGELFEIRPLPIESFLKANSESGDAGGAQSEYDEAILEAANEAMMDIVRVCNGVRVR